ncbi:MAG: AzlC family ABC transporter permease [Caldicoprobacter sp.]|uniref:AzlC family ABC transporter permease n=1 Tax=Caldicoprobacter sp. TaxID=2004500 RepID=UPI0039C1692F
MTDSNFVTGIKKSVPVVLGYIPIGMAFGILASQQGLSIFEIFMMSSMVYAGASQFIATAMIASGINAASVIFTVFLVNLRHMLMSASLSPYFRKVPSIIQALISFGLTDETYALDITHLKEHEPSAYFFMGLHTSCYATWVISTVMGGMLGNLIPDPTRWGMDYALSAMFIALLCIQIKDKRDVLVAICSAAFSLLITTMSGGSWNVIISTILAATIGVSADLWNKKLSLSSSE